MKKLMMVAGLVLVLGSCYNDKYDKLYPVPPVICDTNNVSYTTVIVPILNASCNVSGGCHDAAGAATSGYDFTTYAGLRFQALNGSVVSDITGAPTTGHNTMPKNLPKMSQCNINKMTAWVNQGAQNN